MRKDELEARLKMVAPALSDKELIPVLTHFWFQGDTVMAFNDQIAIQTKLKTDFTGAVPGRVLLDLLGASKAHHVKFTLTDDNLLVQLGSPSKKNPKNFIGRTKIDLKVLPVEDFIHDMPEVAKDAGIAGSQNFIPAIDCCMQSISNDTSIPDQLGLTVIPNGKYLHLYATNNQTLSHAKIKADTKLPGRVILSKPFCEQLLKLTDGVDFRLIIDTDHAMVVTDEAKLFGRLVSSEHPLDFNDILQAHLPDGKKLKMITLPDNLEAVLRRALVITDTKMEETKSLITIKDGKMTVVSKSTRGELKDNVNENKPKDDNIPIKEHPDISVRLNPRLLKAGYGRYEKLFISESCAVMTKGDTSKDGTVYLVSATN